MKLPLNRNKKINDNNLLPLVNIIFLLLIFFMIAGVIQKQKELYNVDLGKATIDNYTEREINTLFINKDGSIILNDEDVSFSVFEKTISQLNNKSELLIAADKELTAAKLNRILLILNNQSIKKIFLMTSKNDA
tara:strand:- start:988 stop:1389 length:402 start_codon:yes stop_codon:yes gene_type:complete